MTAGQVLFYGLLLLFLLWHAYRWLMRRGITEYAPAELKDRLRMRNTLTLVDVRTAAERSAHRLDGSLHIPLHELSAREQELEPYREREIICYCRSGNRSLTAAARLRRRGFRVAHLKGGLVGWQTS